MYKLIPDMFVNCRHFKFCAEIWRFTIHVKCATVLAVHFRETYERTNLLFWYTVAAGVSTASFFKLYSVIRHYYCLHNVMSVPSCQLNAEAKYICRTVQSNFHMSNIFQKFLFLYCIDVYLKNGLSKKTKKKEKNKKK